MSTDLPERYTLVELANRRSCALCGKRLGATNGICYSCESTSTVEPTKTEVGYLDFSCTALVEIYSAV